MGCIGSTDSDVFIVGSAHCSSGDVLTDFAPIVKARLCPILCLLKIREFASDNELGKVWVLFESQELEKKGLGFFLTRFGLY